MPTEAGRDKESIFQLSHESQSCFPSSLMDADVNVCKFDVRSSTTTTRLQKVDCRVPLLLLLPPVLPLLRPDELLSTAGYLYLVPCE